MSDQQHCINCLRETQGFYSYPCQQCNWSPDQHDESGLYLSPGTILHNQYQIGKILGHGGFGITYLAWDNNLETKLAIKEYMPRDFATRNSTNAEVSTFAGDAKENFAYGLDRFLDEARTLAKFQQHVGIVSVLNFFKGNGTGYMVMEYVDGLTLKDYVADMGKLSWERTFDLFMPVMDALREVHKHNMLHRDIAPDNIYLCRNNQIKLLDFGSARYALGGHSRSLSVVVKPGYAPEEQYRAKGKQGAWTDVYSVAASMYRCITGVVPPEALDRMDEDELVRPSKLGVQIPAVAEEAMMAALAIKADNRIQSIEAFQQALWKKMDSESLATVPDAIPTFGKAPSPEQDADPWVQKDKIKERESYGKALLGFLAFFVVALFFFIQYFSKNTEQTESIPAPTIQIQALSKNTDQQAIVDEGIRFYNEGSYEKALNILRPAAEQGDATAQYSLGWMYYRGLGVTEDYQQAAQWYSKAAMQGEARAQYSLGYILNRLNNEDDKQIAQWYQKAAEQGYVHAQNSLGDMYTKGRGVQQDYQQAVQWYRKAAEQGDTEALYRLGVMYTEGRGVQQDYQQAVLLYRKAAEQAAKEGDQQNEQYFRKKAAEPIDVEHTALDYYIPKKAAVLIDVEHKTALDYLLDTMVIKPIMYNNGKEDVQENYLHTAQWYRKAAEQGDATAQLNLSFAYANGHGVTEDDQQAMQWVRKAADQGYDKAQSQLGSAYRYGVYDNVQDNQQAALWYRKAADQGNAGAQYNLGAMYYDGQGVAKDDQQAALWYQKAAEQGYATAQSNLGSMYANGEGVAKDEQQAALWYRKAAEQGNADAQSNLGFMYENGLGVTQDYQQAVQWYRRAAEQGNAAAQSNLGVMYGKGQGVKKDHQQELQWYRKAAVQGNPGAEYNLGVSYRDGAGVHQDYRQALQWFHKAAAQGYENAESDLGNMYSTGRGVKQNYQQAVQWFQKAAEQGYDRAQFNLGNVYTEGRGVKQNYQQAALWYRKAADQGHAGAQFNLGSMYHDGQGVTQDDQQAVQWWRKAADQGNASAQVNLGLTYELGHTVTQDYQQAVQWYLKAAAQDDAKAIKALKDLGVKQ